MLRPPQSCHWQIKPEHSNVPKQLQLPHDVFDLGFRIWIIDSLIFAAWCAVLVINDYNSSVTEWWFFLQILAHDTDPSHAVTTTVTVAVVNVDEYRLQFGQHAYTASVLERSDPGTQVNFTTSISVSIVLINNILIIQAGNVFNRRHQIKQNWSWET